MRSGFDESAFVKDILLAVILLMISFGLEFTKSEDAAVTTEDDSKGLEAGSLPYQYMVKDMSLALGCFSCFVLEYDFNEEKGNKMMIETTTENFFKIESDKYGVKCIGNNEIAQLGRGDSGNFIGVSKNQVFQFVAIKRTGIDRIWTGGEHGCVRIHSSKGIHCWGVNFYGQLLSGDDRFSNPNNDEVVELKMGKGRTVKDMSAGGSFNCAILDDDGVKCWGLNAYGQLGLEHTSNIGRNMTYIGYTLPYVNLGKAHYPVKHISCGYDHSCAIMSNSQMKCWGFGYFLGYEDTKDRGAAQGQMGDNLPFVNLGKDLKVLSVVAGTEHTCVIIKDKDMLKCYGFNYFGQLGYGHLNSIGYEPNQMGDNLPFVDLGTGLTVKQVSLMLFGTCALLSNDMVKCWGHNKRGELGLGHTNQLGDKPGDMGDALPFLNFFDQAPKGNNGKIMKIASGHHHNCVIFWNHRVKCWGINLSGEIGLGDYNNYGWNKDTIGDHLPFVKFIGRGENANN